MLPMFSEKMSACFLVQEHAGIELCLGPLKDQEDRTKKIREDPEEKKPKADLDRAVREISFKQLFKE